MIIILYYEDKENVKIDAINLEMTIICTFPRQSNNHFAPTHHYILKIS